MTASRDAETGRGRTFLGIYGPPADKAWADMTDDEIDAWAAKVAAIMRDRLAEDTPHE